MTRHNQKVAVLAKALDKLFICFVLGLERARNLFGLNREYSILLGNLRVNRRVAQILKVFKITKDQSVRTHDFRMELGVFKISPELSQS